MAAPRPLASSTVPFVCKLFPLYPGYVMTVWAFAKPRHIRRMVIHLDIDDWKVMVLGMSIVEQDKERGKLRSKGDKDGARAQRCGSLLCSLG